MAAMSDVHHLRAVAVLGATGSVGASTLDVIGSHPDRFALVAVSAHRNWEKMRDICIRFRPRVAAMLETDAARHLDASLREAGVRTEVLGGVAGLCAVATLNGVDTVLAAIVGAAGLEPTLAAAAAGKRILLANKEALVMGGALFMSAAAQGRATVLPIDSEHNAIFQCLPPTYARDADDAGVRRLILTASGGPFRTRALSTLHDVTPDEACAQPNWTMGRKISVDSATMMNKALEVIEAHRLFGVAVSAIDVLVHPQSIVHSLVEYVDGSVLAQLGHPDMRTPIAQALAFPDRVAIDVPALDLAARGRLDFESVDHQRFPSIRLAYDVLDAGDFASVTLNAANEVAVDAFLGGRIAFTRIAPAVSEALEATSSCSLRSIDDTLECDRRARSTTAAILKLDRRAVSTELT